MCVYVCMLLLKILKDTTISSVQYEGGNDWWTIDSLLIWGVYCSLYFGLHTQLGWWVVNEYKIITVHLISHWDKQAMNVHTPFRIITLPHLACSTYRPCLTDPAPLTAYETGMCLTHTVRNQSGLWIWHFPELIPKTLILVWHSTIVHCVLTALQYSPKHFLLYTPCQWLCHVLTYIHKIVPNSDHVNTWFWCIFPISLLH